MVRVVFSHNDLAPVTVVDLNDMQEELLQQHSIIRIPLPVDLTGGRVGAYVTLKMTYLRLEGVTRIVEFLTTEDVDDAMRLPSALLHGQKMGLPRGLPSHPQTPATSVREGLEYLCEANNLWGRPKFP